MLDGEILSGLDPYLRWVRKPLGSLTLTAMASMLCGLFLHPQGFVVGSGVLVVTALGLVWPWLSVRGLGGSLAFDRARCREGEAMTARLTLRNRAPWGVWGVAVRGGFHSTEGDGHLAGLAYVPGRHATETDVEFVPDCRGEYPLRPPRVVCGFPFGLWEASKPLDVAAPLLVWPRTFPVPLPPDAGSGHDAEGLDPLNRAGDGGDLFGVRPYRRGDPLRRVHWGQTARHGELIVCEVQANAVPRVQIILDAHPAAHAGSGADGSREWAVRVAASFAEAWIGQGVGVELVLDSVTVLIGGRSIRSKTAAALDALARLGADGTNDLAALLNRPECQRFVGGCRVVVTTDRGLRGLGDTGSCPVGSHFVVLNAGAFGGGTDGEEDAPRPVTPWIRVDGPVRAGARLRRVGKEVGFGR